jgi:hypothetical protein
MKDQVAAYVTILALKLFASLYLDEDVSIPLSTSQ